MLSDFRKDWSSLFTGHGCLLTMFLTARIVEYELCGRDELWDSALGKMGEHGGGRVGRARKQGEGYGQTKAVSRVALCLTILL